jgi:hypothetical protein
MSGRLGVAGWAVAQVVIAWLLTPRGVVTLFLGGQGLIRLIDGRLFRYAVLPILPDAVYGHLQFLAAVGLALTATRRTQWIGGAAAAFGAGVCGILVMAAWRGSATSAWGALVLCALMVAETLAARRFK